MMETKNNDATDVGQMVMEHPGSIFAETEQLKTIAADLHRNLDQC